MRRFASLALVAGLGLAAAMSSVPAHAGVVVDVGVPLPGVVVAPPYGPPVVASYYGAPYAYGGPRYFRPGVHYAYGYYGPRFGYHGPRFAYGYRGFHGYGRAWR